MTRCFIIIIVVVVVIIIIIIIIIIFFFFYHLLSITPKFSYMYTCWDTDFIDKRSSEQSMFSYFCAVFRFEQLEWSVWLLQNYWKG